MPLVASPPRPLPDVEPGTLDAPVAPLAPITPIAAVRPADPLEVLGEVIREQRARLTRIARREGLNAEDAVDCVHDACCTFLRLSLAREVPEEHGQLVAFLSTVVQNAARNARRLHRVARSHEPLAGTADDERRVPEAPSPLADVLVSRAEEHIRLRACVERLCDTQKAVVTLRLLEEQPGEDVAAVLGVSRAYVDVLLHRAKGSLYACMTEKVAP